MHTIPSRQSLRLLSFFLLLFIFANVAQAGPPDAWFQRMQSLYGVTYGQGLFVAVGDGGTIQTSRDGITWGAISTYTTFKNLRGVAYGSGLFVAIGNNGVLITSPNGHQWTSRSSQSSEILWGVTYGNGLYVAVGGTGTIVTSPNGIDWTKQDSKVKEFLYGVAYGNGKFVAVGNSGRILTSANGVDWAPQQVTSYELRGVAFGKNTFMAVGQGGTILSSSNGLFWSSRSIGIEYSFYGITYGNGIFAPVGEDLSSHRGIIYIEIGSYSAINIMSFSPFYGSGYGESNFIALGGQGSIQIGVPSADNILWQAVAEEPTRYLNAVLPCNNKLVAVGDQVILDSPNGVTWRLKFTPSSVNLWSIASNGATCVAVGDWGTILTSRDSEYYWATSPIGTSDWLSAVTYGGNGKFVALGISDKVYTSPDGTTWNNHPLGSLYWVRGISYGNNKYVAVGFSFSELREGILTSLEGENWNFSALEIPPLNAIVFGKGIFVAVGNNDYILTSENGTTWTPAVIFPSSNNLYDIAFAGDSFFAVGAQGTIIYSEDGKKWSQHYSPTTKDLHGAAWAGSYGIAVGADGTFLQSGINARRYLPLLIRN